MCLETLRVVFVGVVLWVGVAEAHVGLTFPPARKYDLDFLDNIRTKPPCGMPKGDVKTSLMAGTTVNVTWHLSYPHRGGYRLELMDSQERQLLDLTPKHGNESYIKGDPTAQFHAILLPSNFTCMDCTIRLLRQASEWANKYRFWSCADVDIVQGRSNKVPCSGHGRAVVGRCVCNKGFWGERCQYEDECETEAECGGNGKCIDLGGTALPKRQCFCNPGFFGPKCLKRNRQKMPYSKSELDLSRHTKRVLSDRVTLHYRIVPASREEDREIEMVLQVLGTSYGALGWRPSHFDKSCKRWPLIQPSQNNQRQPKHAKVNKEDSESIAEPESEPESESTSKYEKSDEGHAEPEAEATAEPEVSAEPESTDVSEDSHKGSGTSASNADKLKAKLRNSKFVSSEAGDVHVETSQIVVTRSSKKREKRASEHSDQDTHPEPEGSAEPEPEGEPEPEAEAEAEPEGSSTGGSYEERKLKPSVWAPKGDFHAMDCIDLVMGAARGRLSRIRDYYTRDRSTPRLDSFWGGTEDLTAASGWEEDGETVLIFRRKLKATDEADHNIEGEMHVIWARGQESGEYNHRPKSGLETKSESPSNANFYAPDEIKYHGHRGQRGIARIDFVAEQSTGRVEMESESCLGGWAHPPGCSEGQCSYNASWRYFPHLDSMEFTVESRRADRWSAIGFSDTPEMRNSDAVIGWVTASGQFFIGDYYMNSYTAPSLDALQDITNMTGSYRDGLVRWSFIRRLSTGDSRDVSLDQCRFFLFPVDGGAYNPVNKKIRKHESVPITSAQRICIPRQCKPPKPPTFLRYRFDIKLIGGLGENWKPPRRESEDFAYLGEKIGQDLSQKLQNIRGFNRLELADIVREGEGAVAKLQLMVKPDSELADKSRVERALNDAVAGGRLGVFQVDPSYLRLEAPTVVETEEGRYSGAALFGGQRLWIILGCVAALIVLALIQALLTIYKVSGKASSQKGSASSGMAWRDYSETNYGYDAYDEKNGMGLRSSGGLGVHHHYATAGAPPSYSGGGGVVGGPSMSLPRPHHGPPQRGPPGANNPDFYFMPSQRKYSGEVVRVYVDNSKRS